MKWPYLKLRWQLLLSYLPVMLIPVVVLGLVIRSVTERGITVLITHEAQIRAAALAGTFEQYYANHGNWDGVGTLFDQFRPGPPRQQDGQPLPFPPGGPPGGISPRDAQIGQMLLTDVNGTIIASDNPNAKGQVLAADVLSHGVPLFVSGKHVATLVIGAALGVMDVQERQLLDTLSASLILSGVLATLASITLALWLSGQLTRPVRDLMAGVGQLASGHWSQPLAVHSHNEFADLTHAFNQMADQLTRQQQQQRQLIADIAHDLRTPLSVIGLEIAGIRAGLQSPEEATDSLQEEVDWLQHLIDDLHTLSLMDTGQFALYPDAISLTAYLNEIGTQWRLIAEKQNKTLVYHIPDDLPVLQIDPFRMRQVFGNLFNNALQHTPDGTQIILQARIGLDQVTIDVIDNGPGIPPNDLPHIFDRFYRADRARTRDRREHGSGLGLSIAYQLVLLHGGMISVDSTLGTGTAFHLRLPCSPPVRQGSVKLAE